MARQTNGAMAESRWTQRPPREAVTTQAPSETRDATGELAEDYRALIRRHRFLVKELERAGKVQRSLLPKRLPPLDGYRFDTVYRPSEAVGGDFYDLVRGDESVVVIVADVVGHGFEAGLTTMLLREIFEETAAASREPELLLTEMNARLHRYIPEGMFAVAGVVTVRPHVPSVRIANAGLPYPFVLRASKTSVEEVQLGGFPLGLFDEVAYEARSVTLGAGDVLLLSTDGIRSIPNDDGEHFEANGLHQVLGELTGRHGDSVLETLMAKALAFGKNEPPADDINLVAITRTR